MQHRYKPSTAWPAARTVVLTPTWPFRLAAERWAQRCRAAGAAVYSVDGRMSARLVAASTAASWRLVVGPDTPLDWVQRSRSSVVVTVDDDDLPSVELASVASEIWACSTRAAEQFRRAGWSGELKLMPYLGAPPTLPPTPGSARSAHPWRLVCTARPGRRSGVDALLLALAALNRSGDPARLRLVDDGAEATGVLRSLAADLELAELVDFAALDSLEELTRWLQWAHAFVLPAVDDGGWPEVAEAQRAGLAMVVADQPTLRSRLSGWPLVDLVPSRSPEAIAAAIRARLGGGVSSPARPSPAGRRDVAPGLVAG